MKLKERNERGKMSGIKGGRKKKREKERNVAIGNKKN